VSAATDSQRALADRLREVLAADARVEAVWLAGSFGRGVGDAWSDIDVLAVVAQEDIAACLAEYGGARNPVGDTVLLMSLFGRIVSAVRPDWERYDIVFLTPQELRGYDRAALRPLAVESLDAPAAPTAPPSKPYQPSADALLDMAHEFLRILGLLPTAIERQEWLSGQEGVGLLRRGLIEMMIEANGVGRAQRGGAKRLSPYLTPEQRAAVEAVPAPSANRESLIAANLALAALFLPLAKETLARAGARWPQAFEDATRAHLARTLGLAI
jgi:predicted nucleotidyltransferase